PAHVAGVVSKLYSKEYARVFGEEPKDPETVLVNVGKVLAAFQEILVTRRTPFDDFRDALEQDDLEKAQASPIEAQRALRIFVGKGNSPPCHFGPAFTNGEFAD